MEQPYQIGLVIYPGMTQLDITGPHQVLSFVDNAKIHFLWKNTEPVTSDRGLTLVPTTSFSECPNLDLICVPGGPGQIAMMQDREMLTFLQKQGKTAKFITSVCTCSLILAAAGLLDGYSATCHWAFLEQLEMLGVKISSERVVVDRDRITGGGVTAGIDFGLVVVSQLCGEQTAKMIQLILQYDPEPPFNSGSPKTAEKAVIEQFQHLAKELIAASEEVTKQVSNSKLNNVSG